MRSFVTNPFRGASAESCFPGSTCFWRVRLLILIWENPICLLKKILHPPEAGATRF
jgi:hypothetical protein